MKLTRQQQLAVDLEGFNILVAAGAGSGKTRVLVERVVRQLEAGLASIDNYLILTFTNAAAAELKERIQLALEQSSNPDVRRQIGRLSVASIKTFHAFCADICRNYAHASDLDSGFRILVDHEANILLRRAVESAMEQSFARRDENFLRLISAFSKENSNERVMEMALKLYRYSYSFVDPHATLEAAADAYTNGDAEKWKRDGFDELRRQFRAIDFTELEAAVAELPEKPMARYRDYIDRYRDYVNTLESLPLDADESASDAPRAPSVRKDEIGAELAEELKNLREEIVEQVKAAITFRAQLRNADEDIELSAPLMRALVDLTHQIAAEYRRAKRRMNFADYNDLEQYAIRILADDGIAGEVRASYRYLYVDEYQDSSAIQEHILDRIARADNRFMVGDIKQSIYKFRNAEPSIFARKLSRFLRIDAMEEAAALAEPNATIVLGDNFRTRREILETINQVFERHMHGEVEFDETAKLNAGAAYESEESSYVEYLRVSKDKEEVAVADRIASLIGTPIYDARAGIFRPCRYRDIVVLHRSPRSVMKDFELEFDRRDIPFYAEPIDGFFQSLEIRLIHALLSIVDNPLRDTEWIAVMRAFFGIDLPTIAHIASLEGSSFFARCKQFLRETENARVERMMQTVEQLQGRVHFMPLDDLIWDLYRVGDFYARMGKLPRGKQRQANLKQLVDIATSVRSSEVVSLSSFLQIVADVKDSGSDYGTAKTLSEADDVVRFMSVHKSKGLEFPIVILAGAARGFQLRDAQGDLILNKNYAIAIAPVETTLRAKHPFFLSTLVGQKNVYEVEQEELRLLYVAMTRAMERLILIGGENDRNGYARWLKELSAPAASTSDEPAASTSDEPSKPAASLSPSALIPDTATVSDASAPVAAIDPEMEGGQLSDEEMLKRLRYRLPRGGRNIETFRPSAALDLSLRAPSLEPQEETLGLRIGSAMHRAMERYVSRNPDPATLGAVLDACAAEFDVDRSLLDGDKILRFMESEIGRRIRTASEISKETHFVFFSEEGKHQGIIDLFFEEDGELVLIDYKTDSALSGSAEQRAMRHRRQLEIYARSLEALKRQKVKEIYLYFLSDGVLFAL